MIRIMKYGETPNSEIFARTPMKTDVAGTVAAIIADVRKGGDAALRAYTRKFVHPDPAGGCRQYPQIP